MADRVPMAQPKGDLGGEGIMQPANKSLLFTPTACVNMNASTCAHYTIIVSAQLDWCAAPTFFKGRLLSLKILLFSSALTTNI